MRQRITGFFGLALMAVFALSVVTASAAMAEGLITGAFSTAKLTGTDVGPVFEGGLTKSRLVFEKEQELRCHGYYTIGNVDETEPGTEEHGWTDLPTSEVTVTPDYTECREITGTSNLPATVARNGCDFDLIMLDTTEPSLYDGGADLTCPKGNSIVVDVYTDEAHTKQACTFTFSPQSLQPIELRSENREMGIGLGIKAIGIVASRTGTPCKGTKTTESVILEAEVEVSATNEAGEPAAIAISD